MTIHTIGPHRVRHGDMMQPLDPLMQGQRASLMYTDPPWGNLRFWQTLNEKQNGPSDYQAPELHDFLVRTFDVARRHVSHYLIVEYGIRWEADIRARASEAGFIHLATATSRYRGGSKFYPLHHHLFATGEGAGYLSHLAPAWTQSVTGQYGYACVQAAIEPLTQTGLLPPGSIILDPCCGMGYTAQAALDYGLHFRGNELNRARLDKTIRRLQKHRA